MPVEVLYDDLENALLWVSSYPEFEAEAFVSRATGAVHLRGPAGPVDDDFPDDIDDDEDDDAYVACPHRNDLDLGRDLVFSFVEEHAPQLGREVQEAFRRKGAYARFKDLLARSDLLDTWHRYEARATRVALAQWAADNGLRVRMPSGEEPGTAPSAGEVVAPPRDLAIPILPSRSIGRTVHFYGRLGFAGDAHPFDASYAILRRGDVEIHFFAHPALDPTQSSAACYVRVADVDRLFAQWSALGLPSAGIPRLDPLADRPWGMRECALVDEDGNLVRIGQVLGEAGHP